jgi:hypothetical protein
MQAVAVVVYMILLVQLQIQMHLAVVVVAELAVQLLGQLEQRVQLILVVEAEPVADMTAAQLLFKEPVVDRE